MASRHPVAIEPKLDPSTVLVAVDFSPRARAAAVRACDLARASASRVRLLHGVEVASEEAVLAPSAEGEASRGPGAGESVPARHRQLEVWCADLAPLGAAVSAIVESEDPVELIARHVHAEDVLLVVMGMHRFRGADRPALGSVADRALRRARVPIMLVKESEHDASVRIHRILLATDFSPASEHALRLAIHWARRLEADLEVLHAIPEDGAPRAYERPRDSASRSGRRRANALESLRSILSRTAAAGVRAVADLTYGAPSIEIVKHAARSRADLVVLGQGGGIESEMARGGVAARVIRHVKCSVLVAPG